MSYLSNRKEYLDRKYLQKDIIDELNENRTLLRALILSKETNGKIDKLIEQIQYKIISLKTAIPRGNLTVFILLTILLGLFILMQMATIPTAYRQAEPRFDDLYIQRFRSHYIPPAKLGYYLTSNYPIYIFMSIMYVLAAYYIQSKLRMSYASIASIVIFGLYVIILLRSSVALYALNRMYLI